MTSTKWRLNLFFLSKGDGLQRILVSIITGSDVHLTETKTNGAFGLSSMTVKVINVQLYNQKVILEHPLKV